MFFDTPKFRLYNNGFILRRRTFYKDGLPQPEHELTLKFRSPDFNVAAAVDVRPLLPCINVIKFKEEILLPTEKDRRYADDLFAWLRARYAQRDI